ncbi:hypothetical protein [Hoeflea sp.]|uniref:hypothetical protein n=1 Tax=Hoeflea sp. TaxID=1940281 RepID=UPI003BAFFD37
MLSEKSPYVVTLLVALITWVANEYYQVTASNGYIQIETALIAENEPNNWRLTVQNLSERVTIREVNLALRCADSPCFRKPENSDVYARDVHVPPLAVTYDSVYEAAALSMMHLNMPPESSFKIEFQTRTGVNQLQPLLVNVGDINVVPVSSCSLGESFDCYFASNFLFVLAVFWVLACLVLGFVMFERHTEAGNGDPKPAGDPVTSTISGNSEIKASDTAGVAALPPQSKE